MQVSGPMVESAELSPGTRLGPYEIRSYLGKGNMTRIYKARHVDTNLERALKVLNPEADQDEINAINWEASLSPTIGKHFNVVSVHESGQQDGLRYLSMDVVNGANLGELFSRTKKRSLKQILEIAYDVANGLEHLHRKRIVHSDVKPGNILVGSIRSLISDFGIAYDMSQKRSSLDDPDSNSTIGTLQFMSPEQACGDELDPRSDVFSLGITLYLMLTGKSPFDADSDQASIRKIIRHCPPPVREFYPIIPQPVEEICMKALEKKPDDRYQTALAFAEAVKALKDAN